MPPDLFNDLLEVHRARSSSGQEIGEKRILGADRFSYPVSADRTLIDATRSPIIVGTYLSEMLLQEMQGLALRSSPVSIPSRAIFVAVAGPTP